MSLLSKFKHLRSFSLVAVLLLLSLSLLAACGDSATATPAVKATSTPMSNEDLAKQAGGASTTAAAGTTAASGFAAGSATPGASPNTSPIVAVATQGTPAATPTGTAQTEPPSLVYPGGREVKLADTTRQQLNANLVSATENDFIGKFSPNNIAIYATSDDLAKAEDFYKKTLEGAGWQLFSRNTNGQVVLLVYQKNGTKFVAQMLDVPQDQVQGLPDDIKAVYKPGDKLIIYATGTAFVPPPTPFAIPGSPTAAVGAGQKKIATIEMESGAKITIELYPDIAPKTVENFEKLANKGFYNGLTFHRVEPGFVVQGGDPKGDGTGGPGYTIPDEFTTQKKHVTGTVAMAHSQAPNSAGSQFYICLADAPHLDGQYAIFGQVTDGMDAVSKIQKGDKMKSVKVEVK